MLEFHTIEPKGDLMSSNIRTAFGIYHVLEVLLKETGQPLTCVDLYDKPEVRKFADSANRVSDYLGHMWRRELLDRVPAPKTVNSQARWAYIWKGKLGHKPPELVKLAKPEEATQDAVPATQPEQLPTKVSAVAKSETILNKPEITITNNGELVTIDLPALTITIRTK
jgi:hypothetical protein